jgi:hypothetical protein
MNTYRDYFGLDTDGKPNYERHNFYSALSYSFQKFYNDIIQMLNAPANPEVNGLWSWNYKDPLYIIEHTKVSIGLEYDNHGDPWHSIFSMRSYDKFDDYYPMYKLKVERAARSLADFARQREYQRVYSRNILTSITEIENGDLIIVLPKNDLLIYPIHRVRVTDARFHWILGHIQNEPWNEVTLTDKDLSRIIQVPREFKDIGDIHSYIGEICIDQ